MPRVVRKVNGRCKVISVIHRVEKFTTHAPRSIQELSFVLRSIIIVWNLMCPPSTMQLETAHQILPSFFFYLRLCAFHRRQ